MKKGILISLFAMSLCWAACEQDTRTRDLDYESEFEEAYPPEPVPQLLTFANGEEIEIKVENGQVVSSSDTLKWMASPLHEGSAMLVRYQVLFGAENETFQGDDSALLSVNTSGEEGVSTWLAINHVTLNDIAEAAGIASGATGTISWKVRAYCGLDKTLSDVTGQFKVKRP